MRILHVIGQRPECTGSGICLQFLLQQAKERGHQNYLVAGGPANDQPQLAEPPESRQQFVKFETQELPFSVPGMSDTMPYRSTRFSDLSAVQVKKYIYAFEKKLQYAVQKFQPDIIHSHHLWLVSGIARQLFPGLPIVATCHGSDLRQQVICGERFQDKLSFCRQLDHIFALTQEQKKSIQNRLQVSETKISVIGSGYDPSLFYTSPKPESGVCDILYAGKISHAKGVSWLLKALQQIQVLPFRLHLAGSGSDPDFENCQLLAQSLKDKVVWHGALSHSQLATLMRESHLFVLPSFFEGFPLVLLEALASGCRIVTTSLPGIKEVFDNISSSRFAWINLPALKTVDQPYPEDEPGLQKKLANVLRKQIQAALRKTLPETDVFSTILAQFTWQEIFQKIEQVYLQKISTEANS